MTLTKSGQLLTICFISINRVSWKVEETKSRRIRCIPYSLNIHQELKGIGVPIHNLLFEKRIIIYKINKGNKICYTLKHKIISYEA